MGFWKNLGRKIKSGVEEVGHGVAVGARFIGDKLQKVGEWVNWKISSLGKKDNAPAIDSFDDPYSPSNNNSNEDISKKQRERENEVITKYQKEIEQRAELREKKVGDLYYEIYKKYIADFEEVLDKELIDKIVSYVKKISLSFSNTFRDEVNTKVNSAYMPWKQLILSHPSQNKLQNYCDKVYAEADNNLLDLLQSAIEDTNKFISQCIVKYNDDKANALKKMKESLVKLTADEETKAEEQMKIAEELAVIQFIASETEIEI